MKVLKLALPAAIMATIFFTDVTPESSWAEAQAATSVTDTMPARDVATPSEDIVLTNSCIEGGKERIYCLCVTKIFKNEMTLRQYRGAAALYEQQNPTSTLSKLGYSMTELNSIDTLSQELSSERQFRTRCDEAETYFAAVTES